MIPWLHLKLFACWDIFLSHTISVLNLTIRLFLRCFSCSVMPFEICVLWISPGNYSLPFMRWLKVWRFQALMISLTYSKTLSGIWLLLMASFVSHDSLLFNCQGSYFSRLFSRNCMCQVLVILFTKNSYNFADYWNSIFTSKIAYLVQYSGFPEK